MPEVISGKSAVKLFASIGPRPLVWLHGEVKTPPFTKEGRQEAGMLLRLLQEGEQLGMPHAELLPVLGSRCGALRIRDAEHNWRVMYRTDVDAVVIDAQDTR